MRILLLISIIVTLSSCNNTKKINNAEANSKSSVWKVEGKGTTLYLGGTIHLLRPNDYPLPTEFDIAYGRSEMVILEADSKRLEDPEIGQIIMSRAMYPEGKGLSMSLKTETYEALKVESAKLGVPIEQLEQFKPSVVLLTLAVVKMQQIGISKEGVDRHYYTKAVNDKKGLAFFETAEQQIDMMVNMGKGYEDEMVMHSLKEFEDMEENPLAAMVAEWKNGASDLSNKWIETMKIYYPDIYKSFLVERNAAWMPQIDQYLEDQKVEFILVGNLHLHGADGLLKQLKNKGYRVTRVIRKTK